MKERLAILVVCVVLAVLCKPSKQIPLCRPSESGDCDESKEQELPSFSSRYRALEYDETVMKLLMEMLLKQHNTFVEEDKSEDSAEIDARKTFPTSKHSSYHINSASLVKTVSPVVVNPEIHDSLGQNFMNDDDMFQGLHNQGNIVSKIFEEFRSDEETEELPILLDEEIDELPILLHEETEELPILLDDTYDNNRFESVPPPHEEHIIKKPYIEWGIDDLEKLVGSAAATPSATDVPAAKNILSSRYKDTRTTSTLNGPHSLLLQQRPFHGFSETLPSPMLAAGNYREHFREPTTKPTPTKKKKINSLKPVDQDQLEILNRPISAVKPMTTPPGVGVRCDENATSCKANNKKTINRTKVKMGQKPAKVMTTTTSTMRTTTERRILGKPSSSSSSAGIRFANPKAAVAATAPSSSTSSVTSKPDDGGNLISAFASSIVDSDENENDAEDSDEENDDEEDWIGEQSDEKEEDVNDGGNRTNFAFSKADPHQSEADDDEDNDDADDDDDDDDDTNSGDVISSVMEEVNALI